MISGNLTSDSLMLPKMEVPLSDIEISGNAPPNDTHCDISYYQNSFLNPPETNYSPTFYVPMPSSRTDVSVQQTIRLPSGFHLSMPFVPSTSNRHNSSYSSFDDMQQYYEKLKSIEQITEYLQDSPHDDFGKTRTSQSNIGSNHQVDLPNEQESYFFDRGMNNTYGNNNLSCDIQYQDHKIFESSIADDLPELKYEELVGIGRSWRPGSFSSEDSGISRSSSTNGNGEDDIFTLYPQTCQLDETDNMFYTTDLCRQDVERGSCPTYMAPRMEPPCHTTCHTTCHPTCHAHQQGEYGNSSLSNYEHLPEPLYIDGPCIDVQNESPSIDEGFDEPVTPDQKFERIIPAGTLPIFSVIQPHIDSDRDSQSSRSLPTSPKDSKKAAKDVVPLGNKERRKPGRKPGQVSNVLHLWEFIRDLLNSKESQGVIEWLSRRDGIFRVINSTEIARLWGEKKKNKKKMTYEKLSRSLRYSRLEGYFAALPRDKEYPKKLCFKFGRRAKGWF